ncbi:transposase family protein [Streptomyces sp. NPDC058256]|uniref:transposase family protein n=1 Tax=Streptomyces sp. NPDC058256 TaxID=3346408 RepID=UPI0036E4FE92
MKAVTFEEEVLFPGLNLAVRQVVAVDDNLIIDAAGCGPPGRCPQCERPATRIHSRYWRHIAGLPVGRHKMIVRLHVRRFFCDQLQCRRRTFVEQVARLSASSSCAKRFSTSAWGRVRPFRPEINLSTTRRARISCSSSS